MDSLDEIFASMPAAAAEADREYLVIDPATRTISVPESERIFGVTGDELADRKYFLCPRYVGDGLDLAGMFIRVNYRNADGDEDGYLVDDVAVVGDYVTFSWRLWPKVTEYKGDILFGVCADLPNTTGRRFPDWNTAMATGEVLEGLHPYDGAVEEETRDVVTQLRAETAAQTAAVAACGAEQVQAVQDAFAAETAAAVAQVAAKGVATLATIPADYTALAGKVNEQANAIKGRLFGKVVQASDVSPVEHYMDVTVRSKNLIPFPFAELSTTRDGVTFTANADGSLTVSGTATQNTSFNLVMQHQKSCLLKKGRLYTLTVTADLTAETGYIYFQAWANGTAHMSKSIRKGSDSFTLSEDGYLQLGVVLLKGVTADQTIYAQLEEGAATEYTPYIDPAGVTVTRCGKNLLPYPYASATQVYNGVTFTPNEDGSVTVNGTATGDGISFMLINTGPGGRKQLPAGTYFMSCPEVASTELYMSIFFYDDNETTAFTGTSGKNQAFTLEKPQYYGVYFRIYGGTTVTNLTLHPQLERGDVATAYEPYNGAKAMPAEDGSVGGITSLAPNMTLLTDTAGVTIECTYNRDTNAVVAEILAKIAALSGTT